ncbi:MAG TPA: TetR family transcriptional regulator [Burkholderiales bacterium]
MTILHRAVQAEDKAARRAAILDAAETLLARDSDNFAAVAQVAEAAGLAKGTVYLYFQTKEEILMALHERHSLALFARIDAMFADTATPLTRERAVDGFCAFMRATPLYLQLACFCHMAMERNINLEVVYQFRLRTAGHMARAGAILEHRFPALAPGAGVQLLHDTYAFALGAWQLAEPSYLGHDMNERPGMEYFRRDFYEDLRRGLLALWRGHLQALVPPEDPASPAR